MATKNQLVFDIGADSSGAQKALADLRSEYDATINALKSRGADIALFKAAQQDAARLEAQIAKLGKTGADTSGLNAALTAQRAALAQQAAALQKAGINTNALTTEQARLRAQADQVTRTFRTQSAALDVSGGLAAGIANIRTLAATFGIAFGAASLVEFTKGIIEAQGRLFELKQITGLTVPTLAGLSLVAKQSGTDIEALAKGVGFFSKVFLAAQDPTSKESKMLAGLGIDAKTSEGALLQIADLLQSLPEGMDKSAIAAELLSKRVGQQLIPAFSGGADSIRKAMEEAQRLNQGTDESAKKFHEFDDALVKLGAQAKGFGAEVALPIVSGLTRILEAKRRIDADKSIGWWESVGLKIASAVDQRTAVERLALAEQKLSIARSAGSAENAAFWEGQIAELKKVTAAEQALAADEAKADPAKAARLEVQKKQNDELAKSKEVETERIKVALAKQEEAYRKSNEAINKTEDDRVAQAKKNAERLLAITTPTPKLAEKDLVMPDQKNFGPGKLDDFIAQQKTIFLNQMEAQSSVNEMRAKATSDLAKAVTVDDFEKVIALGEKAAGVIAKLNEAKASSPSELAAQQRAIADLQDKALQGKGKAEEAIAAKNLALVEQTKKDLKEFEEKPFVVNGKINFDTAKANMAKAMADIQADLDAKPLRVEVIPVVKPPLPQGTPSPTAPQIEWSKHATGTILPGYGGGDRWPVLVESGEAIMRKEAVRHYGANFMRALNAMAIGRFAQGGLIERAVSGLPAPAGSPGGSSDRILNLTLPGVGTFETRATAVVADELERALRTTALKHGRRR